MPSQPIPDPLPRSKTKFSQETAHSGGGPTFADQLNAARARASAGDQHGCIRMLVLLLDAAKQAGDVPLVATVYHDLAQAQRAAGFVDMARRFQMQSVQLQPDCGHAELTGLASDAILQGQSETARQLLEAACQFQSRRARTSDFAIDLGLLAIVDGMDGDPSAGLIKLRRAKALFVRIGDHENLAKLWLNAAELFGQLSRRRAERACLRRARAAAETSANAVLATTARNRLRRVERLLAAIHQPADWN